MAKIKAADRLKKVKNIPVKGCLTGLSMFYGFYKQTMTVSFTSCDSGLPVKGLTKSNFSAVAVQTPGSWQDKNALTVSNVKSNAAGVYTFLLSQNGNNLAKGNWTVVVRALINKDNLSISDQMIIQFLLK